VARVTKSKGRVQQRERSLPDKGIPPAEPERWHLPEANPDLQYKINIPMPGVGRIIGQTQFDELDRMTRFCLTAQVFLADAWWDVVRVDTCHDEVHAHYMYRIRNYEEREVIKPIYCQNDVDRGYQLAEALLIASWSDNVARWHGGS
jgi:hypothetical protein